MQYLSSTSLVGTTVRNREGETLGDLKDLMVDLTNGRVEYAVLDFGGFLGIGNKLFAVPLEAFRPDTVEEQLVLDIDKARLENAPGFDSDNWPNAADDSFTEQVYAYYGHTDAYRRSRLAREAVLN